MNSLEAGDGQIWDSDEENGARPKVQNVSAQFWAKASYPQSQTSGKSRKIFPAVWQKDPQPAALAWRKDVALKKSGRRISVLRRHNALFVLPFNFSFCFCCLYTTFNGSSKCALFA